MKLTLHLQHVDGTISTVEIDRDRLDFVSIIKYEDKLYMYRGLSGPHYSVACFSQVPAPVELSAITSTEPTRIRPT